MLEMNLQNLRSFLLSKAEEFAAFAHNKETGEIFGRTWKSWAQIGAFFLVFYFVVGGIFISHVAVFVAIVPDPAEDAQPQNFGRYAYPNYPNAKIALLSTPHAFSYDGVEAILSKADKRRIGKLLDSANQSGVSSECLDADTLYGYATGEPCIFLRIQRVFEWTPDLVNSSLSSAATLPITCTHTSSVTGLVIQTSAEPNGIPLNIATNNDDARSFPYRHQDNYVTPLMGLRVNLTGASVPQNQHKFAVTITCSVDFTQLGMDQPSKKVLRRLYEIPADATTTIHFKL